MPVSKRRKKDGKPVHRKGETKEEAAVAKSGDEVEHPEGHPPTPVAATSTFKASRPPNPFVAQQNRTRAAGRGR